MTSSSQALEPMPTTASTSEPLPTKPHTDQPGSIKSGGMLTTEHSSSLGDVLGRMAARFKPVEETQAMTTVTRRVAPVTSVKKSSPSELPEQPKPKAETISEDMEQQNQLTLLLYQTYASQNSFSDKAMEMEHRDAMFQLVLGEFTINQVREAFRHHVRFQKTLPTPSDIANLIEPPEPKPDWAAFIDIKQRMKSVYVTQAEQNYVRWCSHYVSDKLDVYQRAEAEREIKALEQKF